MAAPKPKSSPACGMNTEKPRAKTIGDHAMRRSNNACSRIKRLNCCMRMISLGSRPVVAAHVCGVSVNAARSLYRSMFGKNAPRGMLPCSADWYFRVSFNRIESSIFAALHARLLACSPRLPRHETFVTAWKVYAGLVRTPRIDIDRAWFLLRLIQAGEILAVRCPRCRAYQVVMRYETLHITRCISCARWNNSHAGKYSRMMQPAILPHHAGP